MYLWNVLDGITALVAPLTNNKKKNRYQSNEANYRACNDSCS